jgi:hypothetical protein
MRNKGSLLTSPLPNEKIDAGGTFGYHNETFFTTVSKKEKKDKKQLQF